MLSSLYFVSVDVLRSSVYWPIVALVLLGLVFLPSDWAMQLFFPLAVALAWPFRGFRSSGSAEAIVFSRFLLPSLSFGDGGHSRAVSGFGFW